MNSVAPSSYHFLLYRHRVSISYNCRGIPSPCCDEIRVPLWKQYSIPFNQPFFPALFIYDGHLILPSLFFSILHRHPVCRSPHILLVFFAFVRSASKRWIFRLSFLCTSHAKYTTQSLRHTSADSKHNSATHSIYTIIPSLVFSRVEVPSFSSPQQHPFYILESAKMPERSGLFSRFVARCRSLCGLRSRRKPLEIVSLISSNTLLEDVQLMYRPERSIQLQSRTSRQLPWVFGGRVCLTESFLLGFHADKTFV